MRLRGGKNEEGMEETEVEIKTEVKPEINEEEEDDIIVDINPSASGSDPSPYQSNYQKRHQQFPKKSWEKQPPKPTLAGQNKFVREGASEEQTYSAGGHFLRPTFDGRVFPGSAPQGSGPGGKLTAFDYDLDSMEERPWEHIGADISDYFNYGFDKPKWQKYALEQLRKRADKLDNKNKIQVFDSGSTGSKSTTFNLYHKDGTGAPTASGDGSGSMFNLYQKPPAPPAASHFDNTAPLSTSFVPVTERACYNCQKFGHMSRDCPEPPKGQLQPNLYQRRDGGSYGHHNRGGFQGGFQGQYNNRPPYPGPPGPYNNNNQGAPLPSPPPHTAGHEGSHDSSRSAPMGRSGGNPPLDARASPPDNRYADRRRSRSRDRDRGMGRGGEDRGRAGGQGERGRGGGGYPSRSRSRSRDRRR